VIKKDLCTVPSNHCNGVIRGIFASFNLSINVSFVSEHVDPVSTRQFVS
jgi:hypothetical protein